MLQLNTMKTTPTDPAAAVSAAVRQRVRNAVGIMVRGVVRDLRQACQVEVQYVGKRIIRSRPGEPPRREFGNYRIAFDSFVEDRGSAVHGEAGNRMMRAVYFRDGTSRMKPRPHFEPVHKQLLSTVRQRFADAMNNQ
jgi:hypothetical protein